MFCLNCGQKVPDGAKFCLNCGTAVPEIQPTPAQQPAQSAPAPEYPAAQYAAPVKKNSSAKRNIIILVIVAVILIVGGAVGLFASGTIGGSNPDKILETAEKYLAEEDYEEAIFQFEKLLEIDPLNVDAYLGLAETYEAQGDTDKAIEVLEEALGELEYDEKAVKEIEKMLSKLTASTETSGSASDTAEAKPAVTTTAATTTTEPADNADIKYEDFVGFIWRSYEITLGNETTDTYRILNFFPDHILYAGGMFQCDGRNISTDGNCIHFDIVGAECKLIYNNEDDTLTLIRVLDGQTETQVFYRDGFNELAQTTPTDVENAPSKRTAELLETINFPDMVEITTDKLMAFYGIDKADVTDISAYVTGSGAVPDQFGIFVATDANAATRIRIAIEAYIYRQMDAYRDYAPDEMYKFDDCFVKNIDNTIIYAVCSDNIKAESILRQ